MRGGVLLLSYFKFSKPILIRFIDMFIYLWFFDINQNYFINTMYNIHL